MTRALKSALPHNLRRLLYGPEELRAGWRLLIFVGIVALLLAVKGTIDRRVADAIDKQTWFLVGEVIVFFILLLATWTMGRIERRTVADYGLPGSRALRGQFWQGVVLGFVSVTVLLAALHVAGVFQFGGMSIHGIDVWTWGALWGLAFLAVALKEEF